MDIRAYRKPISQLVEAASKLEAAPEGSAYEEAKERFLDALALVPEEFYRDTAFSYEMGDKLRIFNSPHLCVTDYDRRLLWTMTTERGTVLRVDIPGLSATFERTMARNLAGQAEAVLEQKKQARRTQARTRRITEALDAAEIRKLEEQL